MHISEPSLLFQQQICIYECPCLLHYIATFSSVSFFYQSASPRQDSTFYPDLEFFITQLTALDLDLNSRTNLAAF